MIVFLMMTFVCTSQTITKDSVTISKPVFKSIMKESRKCDSLKIAFDNVNLLLSDLMKSNLNMFKSLENEQTKRRELQLKINQANKELQKITSRKKRGWVSWTIAGLSGIILGGVIF